MINKQNIIIGVGFTLSIYLFINNLLADLLLGNIVISISLIIIFITLFLSIASNNKLDVMEEHISLKQYQEANTLQKNTLKDVGELVAQQTQIIEHELNRTTILMGEAIEGISNSFKQLQRCSTEQQTIINNIILQYKISDKSYDKSLDCLIEVSSNTLSELTPQIAHAVNTGIKSLQFEDINNQSILSVKNNVSSLNILSAQLLDVNNSGIELSQALLNLQLYCCNTIKQNNTWNEKRTVSQSSMDAGDIDLF